MHNPQPTVMGPRASLGRGRDREMERAEARRPYGTLAPESLSEIHSLEPPSSPRPRGWQAKPQALVFSPTHPRHWLHGAFLESFQARPFWEEKRAVSACGGLWVVEPEHRLQRVCGRGPAGCRPLRGYSGAGDPWAGLWREGQPAQWQ